MGTWAARSWPWPCPGPDSLLWSLGAQAAVCPKAPPSSRCLSLITPCLLHPIFLVVFFISMSLGRPVLLPGAFSRMQVPGVDWVGFEA